MIVSRLSFAFTHAWSLCGRIPHDVDHELRFGLVGASNAWQSRRAAGGAKSGALEAQNQAQQLPAENRTESQSELEVIESEGFGATVCEPMRDSAQRYIGGRGIRTHGRTSPSPVFKTGA